MLKSEIHPQMHLNQPVQMPNISVTKEEKVRANLLIELSKPRREESVLSLCCGMGLVAVKLSGFLDKAPKVADINLANVNSIKKLVTEYRLNERIKVCLLKDLGGKFDLIFLQQPSFGGMALMRELLIDANDHLKNGGRIYLISTKREGAAYHNKLVESVFGNKERFRSGKYFLLTAKKEREIKIPAIEEHKIEISLLGIPFIFYSRAGLFSKSEIDLGTYLLISNMKISENDTVLDFGCGYGPIGIVAAKFAKKGTVLMVDSNSRAIELAKKNIKQNKIENAEAIESDGFSMLRGMQFDVIVSNPPSHTLQNKLRLILGDALNALKKNGRMYLVVQKSLVGRYKELLNSVSTQNYVENIVEGTKHVILIVKLTAQP